MRRRFNWLFAAFAALILTGCASKDPMEYLPEGTGYFALNLQQVREQAGAKRLLAVFDQMKEKPVPTSDKLTRMYFSFGTGAGQTTTYYGIMVGQGGAADEFFEDVKAQQSATETKIEGRRALDMGEQGAIIRISDTGVAMVANKQDFATMMNTSKDKHPAALASPTFQKLQGLIASHALSVVVDAEPLLAAAGGQLGMLAALNPKGYAALQEVKTASVVGNWDEQPVIEALAYVQQDKAEDLAGLVNFGLAQVKGQLAAMGGFAGVADQLQAQTTSEGVRVTMQLPKEEAEEFLTEAEQNVAELPEDPEQRQQALQGMIMESLMSAQQNGAVPTQPTMPIQPGQFATPTPAVPGQTPGAGTGFYVQPSPASPTPGAATPMTATPAP